MSKPFSLLFTIAFLGAQMFSFAHTAEYGSSEHDHEGTACEICLSAKCQDCPSPGTKSEVCLIRHVQYVPKPPAGSTIVWDTYDEGITRGPPLYL
ncbi:MAG: hypothetical protein OXC97_08010 [Candidatus Dadabacteria bacterium]|nr:hypothetical protein [Candidatus Dadabacteria bacterium]